MNKPHEFESQLAEDPELLKAVQDWELKTDVTRERNEADNFEALPRLPEAVWRWPFNKYWEAVKDSTEAPAEFHLGSLLISLGAVIGRRAYVVSPTPIYPNLYVCLVGSTSDDRKSTAADLAVGFAENVASEIYAPGAFGILRGIASAEGLAQQMSPRDTQGRMGNEGAARLILDIERELQSLISKSRQSALENVPSRLTELYDCPETFEVNTRNNAIRLEQPFLSILAGSTFVWLAQCVSPTEAASGQFNRWQFFVGHSEQDIPNPKPPRFGNLISEVAERLRFSHQELHFTRESEALYERYYIWRRRQRRAKQESAFENDLTARSDLQAKKIALIYATLSGKTVIEPDDLSAAIEVGKYCDEAARYLVRNVLATRESESEKRIKEILIKEKQIFTRDLLRKARMNSEQLERILNCLSKLRLIIRTDEATLSGRTRQLIIWNG